MPQAVVKPVPALRVEPANQGAPRGDGDYVLYWMIASRRTCWNFGLQRAVEWSQKVAAGDYSFVMDELETVQATIIDSRKADDAKAGDTPRLSWLRECGDLEQDANLVLGLVKNDNDLAVHVMKSRDGHTGEPIHLNVNWPSDRILGETQAAPRWAVS